MEPDRFHFSFKTGPRKLFPVRRNALSGAYPAAVSGKRDLQGRDHIGASTAHAQSRGGAEDKHDQV